MPRKVTYQLKEAAQDGEKQITEVTITYKLGYLRGQSIQAGRGASGGEVMTMDPGTFVDVAAKMVGMAPAFLDELCTEDQGHLLSEARDFLFSALGTGKAE